MSSRTDYTVEEWEAIRRAPSEAVIAIEQASPSGFLGRRRERKAEKRGFADVIAASSGLELVGAIVAARDDEGQLIDALRAGGESFTEQSVATAAAARRAIAAKGTLEELEAYASAILEVCGAVALASTEAEAQAGEVSPAEALLLGRLAVALGRRDYEPPASRWVTASGHAGVASAIPEDNEKA